MRTETKTTQLYVGGMNPPTLYRDEGGQEVAVITLTGYKVGHEKNPKQWAALFAAAPELLTALKNFRCLQCDKVYGHKGSTRACSVCTETNELIARAEGRV